MNMGNERGEVFMSVLKVWKYFVPSMPMGLITKLIALDGVNISCISLCLLTFTQVQAGTLIAAVD